MSLVSELELLFDSKEDYDVTFIINDQEINAHKTIVTARSPVLKAMIKGPMAPADQRHQITDPKVSANDFNDFLKFLYTDKCEINQENVEVMLHLSHMYDVSSLFEMCVTKLPEFFSSTSLLKYAELGNLYENKCNILDICFLEGTKVSSNASISSLQYLNNQNETVWISTGLVEEFVKRCPRTLFFTEDIVFEKIYDWAKCQSQNQSLEANAENFKELMAPLVAHLDLDKMNMETITSTIYEYKLVPEERLLKHFRDHIVKNKSSPKLSNLNSPFTFNPNVPPPSYPIYPLPPLSFKPPRYPTLPSIPQNR